MYPPSDIISYHRVERPEHELPPEASRIDVAVLDMNHGWQNLGHDAIAFHLHNMVQRLRPALAEAGLGVRVFSYDIRQSLMVPKPGRFPLLIGTGGPGHLDPHENDGESVYAQGIDEDATWEAPVRALFASILRDDDSTALVAVCHSYGVLCRLSGFAEPVLRSESKGGRSTGVVSNVLSDEARAHPFFVRLARCLPGNGSLRVTDHRLFDLVESSTNGHHFVRLGYESDERGVRGEALTMIEFARDRQGIMPRVLGVNHHPEVLGRTYIRGVLESKWERGEVSRDWYDDRVKTLAKHGEYDREIRVTSIFTFLAPVEFHLTRLVRERRESMGLPGEVDENLVILGAEAACGMEAISG